MMFERLCIIGVGLIGGSLARAAREHGLCRTIIGVGRPADEANLRRASELGVIDRYGFDAAEAASAADLVAIAAPVGSFEEIFRVLKPSWSTSRIYMDAGSTKGSVVEALERVFGEAPANFVPAHPIAGAERSGVEAAVVDLYRGKRVILTPLPATDAEAVAKVAAFWRAMGSEISEMSVAHHDAVLAATSHLPHVVAYALVDMLGRRDETEEIFKYAAGGFRDFTRIASSDPRMWTDICGANRAQILALLKQFGQELGKITAMLEAGDDDRLYETFCYAKRARQRFLDQFEN